MSEPNPHLVFLPLIPAVLLFSVRPGLGYSISLQVLCPAEGRCAKSNPNRGARARSANTAATVRPPASGWHHGPTTVRKTLATCPECFPPGSLDEAQLRTEPRIRWV